MLEKIVVTTDFSDHARAAYPTAAFLGKEFGSEVHLVHVVSPVPPLYYEEVWVDVGDEKYYEQIRLRLDAEARSAEFDDHKVVPHLLIGEPGYRQVVDFAEDLGAGMLIVATHGRTGLGHALLGSFAERLLRYSHVPVLTCKVEERGAVRAPASILVPFDFSKAAEAVFPAVRYLSERFGAHFTFLHVFEPHYPIFDRVPSQSYVDTVRRIEEEAPLTAELRFTSLRERELPGIETRFESATGTPYREIIARANSGKHDLVLLATHGHTGWKHLVLGSVAERVLRHSTCPVLTVHPGRPDGATPAEATHDTSREAR
jgi:nucleotide-binding universal stress UspA family protein